MKDTNIINGFNNEVQALVQSIQAHLNDNRQGERLRDGLHIVITGKPNVGKSTLFNFLAKRDIAIVSEHAGTTRDVLEAHIDIGGCILGNVRHMFELRKRQFGNKPIASMETSLISVR
ncbi:tRNA modification GTPase MnmE [Dirofilaria immitis]|nr:tRNA modification GTPase MnmE [Dirofilaria immitis]